MSVASSSLRLHWNNSRAPHYDTGERVKNHCNVTLANSWLPHTRERELVHIVSGHTRHCWMDTGRTSWLRTHKHIIWNLKNNSLEFDTFFLCQEQADKINSSNISHTFSFVENICIRVRWEDVSECFVVYLASTYVLFQKLENPNISTVFRLDQSCWSAAENESQQCTALSSLSCCQHPLQRRSEWFQFW